ncbi:type IV toxin-antitoxin system AbiEi family antitoxin [Flavitalea sp. BT771]|uniref:type IV toxin-antitoxin system AbiEi family antitoxin n=1 Tax=Flavitalea sp. BT771 TaxID=3063329 RepID=UPI0026E1F502|nr:type IV toxin-antitoxin system AbiEi family antitoxin [Flavitalea sp. BT771]MDO6433145.1 type IV toxin-antitoxin system AbiEi family antitoxin [Flavitalea sp. BT771]MDV6221579.1 type IV toxin-antitoxin system AbiEi family antitoxin [Flavitalea sp. BT771]
MRKEQAILEEAITKLQEYTGLPVEIDGISGEEKQQTDAYLNIAKKAFIAEVKPLVSKGNKASIFSQLNHLSDESRLPVILVTQYIPSEIANEYINNGISYLDIAGNCSIVYKDLVIRIEGKKREKVAKVNQSRAFQEAGIKLLFQLLLNPQNVELTYRELSKLAGVSLGSIGSIMQELVELNFLLVTNKRKVLKNIPSLLERWIIAYHDILRPRLLMKKMRFMNPEQYNEWDHLPIQNADGVVLWGGEPAAALLTNYLSPEKFTIYTNNSWQGLIRDLKIVPDDNGTIEILRLFWNETEIPREKYVVHPLLVYADLMGSNIGRNIETAKMILENELSYLQ